MFNTRNTMPDVTHSAAPLAVVAMTTLLMGCESRAGQDPVGPDRSPSHALQLAQQSSWSPAIRLEDAGASAHFNFNTSSLDGCPFQSRDGKMFFMASNRPGGKGGIDIWVATRENLSEPFGEPVNAGEPVNSAHNDFCPTIDRDGHQFFFVSNRPTWGPAGAPVAACGGADIYVTRLRSSEESGVAIAPVFDEPVNPGCGPDGPNSAADEASPFPISETGRGPVLYFSSARAGGYSAAGDGAVAGDPDIYLSASHGGVYGPATLVPGVNSAFEDAQPNVRRDGLEIFFYSTRTGTLGMSDIYSAIRSRTGTTWEVPVNLGASINTSAGESRPSISWDGTTLYFGSTRASATAEGSSDIYVSTRPRREE